MGSGFMAGGFDGFLGPSLGGGGGGTVKSVNSGTLITVDNTDPANPVVNEANFTGPGVTGRIAAGAGAVKQLSLAELTTLINLATASLPGSLSAALFTKITADLIPHEGAALTDADQTLQPATDTVSEYVQPAATPLSAARNKTFGVTSGVTKLLCRIVRKDTGAFNITVVNGGTNGGNLGTIPPATASYYTALTGFYNGVDWLTVGFEYLAVA